MKLSFSQIAWTPAEDETIFELFRGSVITGIETTPLRLSRPHSEASEYGLKTIAMQALLYKHPELTIFESASRRQHTLTYLKRTIQLAQQQGLGVLIFGSPKNRLRGLMSRETAEAIAVQFFSELGKYAQAHQAVFCLEANPPEYGADFLTSTEETIAFVKKLHRPGLKINLDLGTVIVNQEILETLIPDNSQFIGHVHISEPYLKPICERRRLHQRLLALLAENKYDHWVSIEMAGSATNITPIKQTLAYLKTIT